MAKDNSFNITFKNFHLGASPVAHLDALTSLGNDGHYSAAENIDILTPGLLNQGPGLADLINGNQSSPPGVVDQLILAILGQPTAANVTYGVGTGKLFKITPTTVTSGGTPSWPQTVTNMVNAEGTEPGIVLLKGNVYVLHNKSSGGDIAKMPISTQVIDPDWGSTTPTTGAGALQKAPHPVAKKEDLMVFGNGRYGSFYNATDDELDVDKLDFGNDAEVADVAFHANKWWWAVNFGVAGTNRTQSQILLWDGSAVSSILDDEAAIGLQRIGWIMPIGGLMWVAYQDLSFSGGYKIGYINGRKIVPVAHFTGALPDFNQKTLYKNTILFVSGALIWSCGAVIDELPIQISQHADGGHANVGAIAAPFGVPMVASTDASTNHRLAKFSGYEVSATWRSIIIALTKGRMLGYIDEVIVLTSTLAANARCDLKLEYDQAASSTTTAKQITTADKRRHVFKFSKSGIEDFRVFLNWANGNAVAPCPIREIQVSGHFHNK